MSYVSKKYLNEKWQDLKWDMEMILLNNEEEDFVPEVDVKRCSSNVIDCCEAIINELKEW